MRPTVLASSYTVGMNGGASDTRRLLGDPLCLAYDFEPMLLLVLRVGECPVRRLAGRSPDFH